MEPSRRDIIFLIKRNMPFVLSTMEMQFLEAKLVTVRVKGSGEDEKVKEGGTRSQTEKGP